MRDIWISEAFDDRVEELLPEPDIALHLTGKLKTKGAYRWGEYASRNLGKGWTVDGDAEISLDPDLIPKVDGQPLFCLAGPAKRVSGITTRGNHSVLAKDWPAESLRTGAVLIDGDGYIDNVTFRDFGSLGAETFVAIVTKGTGEAAIINSLFIDFDPDCSDTQVTVRAIMGMEDEEGALRPFVLMEGNRTFASGTNWVQAHTIYQAENGLVHLNFSDGARVGYYGDYYATKGIAIERNEFLACEHGVQLKLSPTPLPLAQNFSHEGYVIGPNKIESLGANVSIDTIGPSTPTRFIRGIKVDRSLSLENFGGEVTRIGEDLNARKGCNPFRR